MKDLSERLAALSPEQRALLERRLAERGIAVPKTGAIRPIAGRENLAYLPTSLDQERLWFIDQMEPGNAADDEEQASCYDGNGNRIARFKPEAFALLGSSEPCEAPFPGAFL